MDGEGQNHGLKDDQTAVREIGRKVETLVFYEPSEDMLQSGRD